MNASLFLAVALVHVAMMFFFLRLSSLRTIKVILTIMGLALIYDNVLLWMGGVIDLRGLDPYQLQKVTAFAPVRYAVHALFVPLPIIATANILRHVRVRKYIVWVGWLLVGLGTYHALTLKFKTASVEGIVRFVPVREVLPIATVLTVLILIGLGSMIFKKFKIPHIMVASIVLLVVAGALMKPFAGLFVNIAEALLVFSIWSTARKLSQLGTVDAPPRNAAGKVLKRELRTLEP